MTVCLLRGRKKANKEKAVVDAAEKAFNEKQEGAAEEDLGNLETTSLE